MVLSYRLDGEKEEKTMEILKTSGDLTKVETYQITRAPNIGKMSEIPQDLVLTTLKWCVFNDINAKGEEHTILSIMTNDGIFATNSATFIREFEIIVDIMENKPFNFMVYRGLAKSGREFISAMLVE